MRRASLTSRSGTLVSMVVSPNSAGTPNNPQTLRQIAIKATVHCTKDPDSCTQNPDEVPAEVLKFGSLSEIRFSCYTAALPKNLFIQKQWPSPTAPHQQSR